MHVIEYQQYEYRVDLNNYDVDLIVEKFKLNKPANSVFDVMIINSIHESKNLDDHKDIFWHPKFITSIEIKVDV